MNPPTVVIPALNCADLTRQCLDLLLNAIENEVVVVDDGSTDETPHLLRRYADRIHVITHATPRGFAVSCNDGAAVASGDSLVFLNNDTLPREGWLDALVRHGQTHPQASIIGGKLLYPDGTIQHAGVVICQDRYPRHIYTGFPGDHPAVGRSRRFQIVTAACMLVRRKTFEDMGGFDTRFRNGFEDVDFCFRVNESGGQVHYCSECEVVHLESVSPGRFDHDTQNVALYRERWMDRVHPDEWSYYLEDGLINVSHEGQYPIHLEVSPLLATLDVGERSNETEKLLRKRARQVADFLKENTRLRMEIAGRSGPSKELGYHALKKVIHHQIKKMIPLGATVAFISKGDQSLVEIAGYDGWHFPMDKTGAYAGYHPRTSEEAIVHLNELIRQGAQYLVIPSTAYWWLDHYTEFSGHLDTHFSLASNLEKACRIYGLSAQLAHSEEV